MEVLKQQISQLVIIKTGLLIAMGLAISDNKNCFNNFITGKTYSDEMDQIYWPPCPDHESVPVAFDRK